MGASNSTAILPQMPRAFELTSILSTLVLAACSGTSPLTAAEPSADAASVAATDASTPPVHDASITSAPDAAVDASSGPSPDASIDAGALTPFDSGTPGANQTITVFSLRSGTAPALVTAALPFALGELSNATSLQLFTGSKELARNTRVLARWADGSLRSLLVGFAPPAMTTPTVTVNVVLHGATAQTLPGDTPAVRATTVRAFADPARWSSSGALGFPFQLASAGTLAPAFFRRAAPVFQSVANPPSGSDADPHVRNYYDHTHALYMQMLAVGPSVSFVDRIDAEVVTYRENEIIHTGTRRGQYSAPPDTEATNPIDFNIVRRMYPQGLVEDYLMTGDTRSLDVAKEMAEAFIADVAGQTPYYPYTERIPAWTILGLLPVFEATGDARYLNAARTVGTLAVSHQTAMAAKYPNQAGVTGLTGSFVQDRRNAWFDNGESTASGAGSSFMTTLLVEALVRLHRDTGDLSYLDSATKAVRWLKVGCFVPSNDSSTVYTTDPTLGASDDPSMHAASFRYVCRADDNHAALPGLNPMFALALGLGWQRTGDESYRTMARDVLAFTDWGYTIKEYNQSLRSSSQAFFLLENPAGTFVPRQ